MGLSLLWLNIDYNKGFGGIQINNEKSRRFILSP
jgi:hypothetical protein